MRGAVVGGAVWLALPLAACQGTLHSDTDFSGRGVAAVSMRAREAVNAPSADRTIIRTASLTVAVPEVAAAQAEVERLVGAASGQVSRTSNTSGTVTMTVRIPDGRLDATLEAIAALGTARARSVASQDVTEEVIDLDARIRALETSRDRLRALHERTNTVDEIIAVERELARVQGELDSLQGRLRSLRSQADLSTVQLTLEPQHVLGPLGAVAAGLGWVVQKLFLWK